MLTKWDDYPVHQTPDPIAFAGTDRNFYDRYFFNGYSRDGSIFFAAALGVYPHLNIMDGAFCVVHEGIQHNVRVSRHMRMERMDTQVGPFAVAVLEPLRRLRLKLDDNDAGITAEVEFEGRAPAVKEPRFTRRIGPRSFMDYTRLTQSGSYRGWIEIAGRRIELSPVTVLGTRDRSWGVRPIGLADPQETVPPTPFQFCWLWAPLILTTDSPCITSMRMCRANHGTRLPSWVRSAMRRRSISLTADVRWYSSRVAGMRDLPACISITGAARIAAARRAST